jgi:hypothetical protein
MATRICNLFGADTVATIAWSQSKEIPPGGMQMVRLDWLRHSTESLPPCVLRPVKMSVRRISWAARYFRPVLTLRQEDCAQILTETRQSAVRN